MEKENLRPEDLMIGDWFRFRYTIDGKEFVHTFRISRIEDELGNYYVWGDGFGRMCYPKRLEPIPLTPEILEKNGWKHDPSMERLMIGCELFIDRERWMSWDSKYRCLKITIRDNKQLSQYNLKELRLDVPCANVHDLQHALRLCGIDKTIVL